MSYISPYPVSDQNFHRNQKKKQSCHNSVLHVFHFVVLKEKPTSPQTSTFLSQRQYTQALVTTNKHFNQHGLKHFLGWVSEKSDCHKEAVYKLKSITETPVETMVNKQEADDKLKRRGLLLKQLSSLRYLLRQGQAIRGTAAHEEERNLLQLLLLRPEDDPDLKAWIAKKDYLFPEITNEIITLMGNHAVVENYSCKYWKQTLCHCRWWNMRCQ